MFLTLKIPACWAASGSITANPNPIRVCDGTGKGSATLTWTSSGTTLVEVHSGSPTGALVASSGPGAFSFSTPKNVTDGDKFYLQDRSGGKKLNSGGTLSQVTVKITIHCGAISAGPNPVTVPDCVTAGLVATTLSWTSSNTTSVEVHSGSPAGTLVAKSVSGPSSYTTPKNVADGTVFYLQDRSSGLPLTAANTLATVTVTRRCGSLSAGPNPITVNDGSGLGETTLAWSSAGTSAVEVRSGSPSGPLVKSSGTGPVTFTTGKTVSDGTTFYLQDVSNGQALTPANTLSTATVTHRSGVVSASLNPIEVCDGTGRGITTLTWNTSGASAVEVHSGSPSGPLVKGSGTGSASVTTDKSVTDGLTFYLQDVSGGRPLTSADTLNTVRVVLTSEQCPQPSVGLNKFDLYQQYLGYASGGDGSARYKTVTRAMAKKAVIDAHNVGVTYMRVSATGYWPRDLDLWRSDPAAYWALFDEMMADLSAGGVRIVPVFVWNWTQFPMMTGETTDQLITNPESASYRLLQSYMAEFILRYKDTPALYFYDLTNELNLRADLAERQRCLDDPNESQANCNAVGDVTTDQIIAFTGRLASLVKSLDFTRRISYGHSLPRKSAEHLRRSPEFSPSGPDWTRDTLEEFKKNLADVNAGADTVSVHFYNNGENERLGVTGHTSADFLDTVKLATEEQGKRLFIGEFSDTDPYYKDDKTGTFTQNVLRKVEELKIPYSAPWIWEFYHFAPYQTYDSAGDYENLEPGYTDLLIEKIQSTNAGLGNPVPALQVPDVTPPQVVLTWPLSGKKLAGTQRVHAVASDNNGAVGSVTFYVDGLPFATRTQPPYQFDLDSSLLPSGAHTISADAADTTGNVAQSSVNVTTGTAP